MASKKNAEQENAPSGGGTLKKAAKAIGAAIGGLAAKAGVKGGGQAKPARPGKLPKRNKKRLPRKDKKAAKKALEAQSKA